MEYPLIFAILVGLSLGMSFLMSGMESGVFALSRLRLRQQMRAGNRRAHLLHRYLEDPENFLLTILVGNTLAMFAGFTLILTGLYQTLGRHPAWFWTAFAALAFVFYAFCDLLPKMLFRQFPTRLCVALVVPFRFIHLALSPLVWLMTWIANSLLKWTGGRSFTGHVFGTRGELRLAMHESQNLTSEERAMINRVLDLQNLTVSSVTVPLSKVVGVDYGSSASEMLRLCRDHGFTRLPVWRAERSGHRIVGLVSLRNALYAPDFDSSRPVSEYVQPAVYLREDLRLEEALRRLQRRGQRLAIVLGFDGREVGIISVQDILQAVFGELSL